MSCRFWGHMCLALVTALMCSSCSPESDVNEKRDATESEMMTRPQLLQVFEDASEAAEREDWAAARKACLAGLEIDANIPALQLFAARAEAHIGNRPASRAHLETAIRLGATADLAADDGYAELLKQTEFRKLADRLLANANPHPPAELFHRFADPELWPEGIAVDSATGSVYVGSIHRRAIYRLAPGGSVEEFGTSSDDDLMEVLGIWVDPGSRTLWAATGIGAYAVPFDEPPRTNELIRYDLDTGDLVRRYPVPDGELRLLNDVVVGPDGTAWATETLRGEVYRVRPEGKLELWRRFPELVYLNGIAISDNGRTLYLGHYGGLSSVSVEDGVLSEVRGTDMALGMVDGLSWVDGRLVMVQNSRHVNFRVVRVDLAEDGLHADGLEVLECGLPEGLIPYTCAVHEGTVSVVAAADFGLMDAEGAPPAPVVVSLPLVPTRRMGTS